METARRILILLVLAGLLAAGANAVSPRGLSWTRPLGRGIAAQVADAGLLVVELKSLKGLLSDPAVLFVDARSPEDYATGHLPGAVHISSVTSGTRPIIVYCANEFCESALEHAKALRKAGHRNVAVFVDGYDTWWNAGGAVEQN